MAAINAARSRVPRPGPYRTLLLSERDGGLCVSIPQLETGNLSIHSRVTHPVQVPSGVAFAAPSKPNSKGLGYHRLPIK